MTLRSVKVNSIKSEICNIIFKHENPSQIFSHYLLQFMMSQKSQVIQSVNGNLYKKYVILSDVNIPYKFCIDRCKNKLFFCINTDEFSDQSFQSVVLNLDTGLTSIVPGIRNGFASAIDPDTGTVYLGGSHGISKYNYTTEDVDKPALLYGVDIFDMYYMKHLYYVDTNTQNVHCYKEDKSLLVPELQDQLIHHFVIDINDVWYFVNPSGLSTLPKRARSPILYDNSNMNFRGAAIDANGIPHFVAQDGIYGIDKESKQLVKIISVDNGYGLAFDSNNNIIYSDERSVNKLIICENADL